MFICQHSFAENLLFVFVFAFCTPKSCLISLLLVLTNHFTRKSRWWTSQFLSFSFAHLTAYRRHYVLYLSLFVCNFLRICLQFLPWSYARKQRFPWHFVICVRHFFWLLLSTSGRLSLVDAQVGIGEGSVIKTCVHLWSWFWFLGMKNIFHDHFIACICVVIAINIPDK